jgi:hypothetical protein
MIEVMEAEGVRQRGRIREALANGPLPAGMKRECQGCSRVCDSDIYIHNGATLCGDCRFKVRTGRWPHYGKETSSTPSRDDMSPWQENAIRCMEDCT